MILASRVIIYYLDDHVELDRSRVADRHNSAGISPCFYFDNLERSSFDIVLIPLFLRDEYRNRRATK